MGAARAKANGAETMAQLKAAPTDDAFGRGVIRVGGSKIHPSYLGG